MEAQRQAREGNRRWYPPPCVRLYPVPALRESDPRGLMCDEKDGLDRRPSFFLWRVRRSGGAGLGTQPVRTWRGLFHWALVFGRGIRYNSRRAAIIRRYFRTLWRREKGGIWCDFSALSPHHTAKLANLSHIRRGRRLLYCYAGGIILWSWTRSRGPLS